MGAQTETGGGYMEEYTDSETTGKIKSEHIGP